MAPIVQRRRQTSSESLPTGPGEGLRGEGKSIAGSEYIYARATGGGRYGNSRIRCVLRVPYAASAAQALLIIGAGAKD